MGGMITVCLIMLFLALGTEILYFITVSPSFIHDLIAKHNIFDGLSVNRSRFRH